MCEHIYTLYSLFNFASDESNLVFQFQLSLSITLRYYYFQCDGLKHAESWDEMSYYRSGIWKHISLSLAMCHNLIFTMARGYRAFISQTISKSSIRSECWWCVTDAQVHMKNSKMNLCKSCIHMKLPRMDLQSRRESKRKSFYRKFLCRDKGWIWNSVCERERERDVICYLVPNRHV